MKKKIRAEEEKKNMTAAVTESSWIIACLVASLGVRIFLFLSGLRTASDPYGFFEKARISAETTLPELTSGIAYAYTSSLMTLLRFVGNRMDMVVVWHMVLQLLSLLLLLLGVRQLFGRIAAVLTGLAAGFAPFMIHCVFTVSPESYYLFFWSLELFLLGIYGGRTIRKGWRRRFGSGLYLLAAGMLAGVLCIWHCAGFSVLPVMLIVLIRAAYGRDKERSREEYLSVPSQALHLLFGLVVGGYATLMKYTGITGEFLDVQFMWWVSQFWPGKGTRLQDMSLWLPLLLAGIILTGGVLAWISEERRRKAARRRWQEKKEKEKKEKEKEKEKEKKPRMEPVRDGETVEEEAVRQPEKESERQPDKKPVTYIENPLPLPKKHAHKKIDFDRDDGTEDRPDDFDVTIDENDDFDF